MILTDPSAYDAPYGFFGDNIMQGSKENIVNILLLAGASKKNISWIMKLRDELLEIQKYSVSVFNYTHWKDGGEIDISEEAKKLYNIDIVDMMELQKRHAMDAVIITVAHDCLKDLSMKDIASLYAPGKTKVMIDVKGILEKTEYQNAGYLYWRL